MISKHGAPLIAEDARVLVRDRLLRRAFLITPNLHEASALSGIPVTREEEMEQAARRLREMGAKNVLVKGGHLAGNAADLLLDAGGVMHWFPSPRIDTPHTHGTGCTYSAAITACLAKGLPLHEAVRRGKLFITEAIRTNPGLGHGSGPVNHHAPVVRN